jgi:hypothetical protein
MTLLVNSSAAANIKSLDSLLQVGRGRSPGGVGGVLCWWCCVVLVGGGADHHSCCCPGGAEQSCAALVDKNLICPAVCLAVEVLPHMAVKTRFVSCF